MGAAAEVPRVAAKGHCRKEDQGRAEGEADSRVARCQRRRASNSSATLLSLSRSASASMLAKSSTPMSP